MGYQKSAHTVIEERLSYWHLYRPKTFSLTLEQLAELLVQLEKPVRIGWGVNSKRHEMYTLLAHLRDINKGKET
jgi:hypothetical protein